MASCSGGGLGLLRPLECSQRGGGVGGWEVGLPAGPRSFFGNQAEVQLRACGGVRRWAWPLGESRGAPASPKSTPQTQGKGTVESPPGPPHPGASRFQMACPLKRVPSWKPTCSDSGAQRAQLSGGGAPVALSCPGSWLLWLGQEALWLPPRPLPATSGRGLRLGRSGGRGPAAALGACPVLPAGRGAPSLG